MKLFLITVALLASPSAVAADDHTRGVVATVPAVRCNAGAHITALAIPHDGYVMFACSDTNEALIVDAP